MVSNNFEKNGFELYKNILSKDITDSLYDFLFQEMNLSIESLKNVTKGFTSGDLVKDINYIFENIETLGLDSSIISLATGLYPLNVRLSTELFKLLESDKLLSILKKLLKTDHLKMHMPPAARFVLPNNKNAMAPAHNDVMYNTYVDDFIVVWVPLTSITIGPTGSGGLAFFESPSNIENIFTKENLHAYWLSELDTKNLKQIHLELEPGDVFIFNKYVVHKSMLNNSDLPRISIDYRFFSGALKSTKHCYDLSTKQIIAPQILNNKEIENVL